MRSEKQGCHQGGVDILKQDGDGMRLCVRKMTIRARAWAWDSQTLRGAVAVRAGEQGSGPQVRPYRLDGEEGPGAGATGLTGHRA